MKMTGLLEKIQRNTDSKKLKVGDIVEALEDQGFGPILLAPALIVILPTGAIPGVPAIAALLIIFVAGQMVLGRKNPWLPKKLAERKIAKEKFNAGVRNIKRYTRRIDRLFKPRMQFLLSPLSLRAIAFLCIVLSIFMIPIGFVPFAVLVPALSIAFLALGISARDGLLVTLGLVVAFIGLPATIWWVA